MFSKWSFPALLAVIVAGTWALSPRKPAGSGEVTIVGNQTVSGLSAYFARGRRTLKPARGWWMR
jgi:hypothetical protein